MANPMMQMLGQSVGKRMPNNPIAMIAEFRKFAQGMTPEKSRRGNRKASNIGANDERTI